MRINYLWIYDFNAAIKTDQVFTLSRFLTVLRRYILRNRKRNIINGSIGMELCVTEATSKSITHGLIEAHAEAFKQILNRRSELPAISLNKLMIVIFSSVSLSGNPPPARVHYQIVPPLCTLRRLRCDSTFQIFALSSQKAETFSFTPSIDVFNRATITNSLHYVNIVPRTWRNGLVDPTTWSEATKAFLNNSVLRVLEAEMCSCKLAISLGWSKADFLAADTKPFWRRTLLCASVAFVRGSSKLSTSVCISSDNSTLKVGTAFLTHGKATVMTERSTKEQNEPPPVHRNASWPKMSSI